MEKFYEKGVRFQCQCSGQCCKTGKDYGYVYLSSKDCKNIAKFIGTSIKQFTKKYVIKVSKAYRFRKITEDCAFLKDNRCSIYPVRPLQCRTWPFWPENMRKSGWIKKAVGFCPGIGKGKLYTAREIDKILNKEKAFDEEHELI